MRAAVVALCTLAAHVARSGVGVHAAAAAAITVHHDARMQQPGQMRGVRGSGVAVAARWAAASLDVEDTNAPGGGGWEYAEADVIVSEESTSALTSASRRHLLHACHFVRYGPLR